jgi:transcriptional regulator with XRE-family HTH domain
MKDRVPYPVAEVAQRLRETRQAKGLTQQARAASMGVPQSQVSNLERGNVDLRTSTLIELARLLELELVLVPRAWVPAISQIISSEPTEPTEDTEPLYQLGTSPKHEPEHED